MKHSLRRWWMDANWIMRLGWIMLVGVLVEAVVIVILANTCAKPRDDSLASAHDRDARLALLTE